MKDASMWCFHLDELSDWSLGEVYAAGGRYVNTEGKLKVSFLNFVDIPEESVEDMFEPSTLKLLHPEAHVSSIVRFFCCIAWFR